MSLIIDSTKCSFFVINCQRTICSTYKILFKEIYKQIFQIRIRIEMSEKNYFNNIKRTKTAEKYSNKINAIRLEQIRHYNEELILYLSYFNQRFLSKFLFYASLVTFPPNIYLLTFKMVHKVNFINSLFILSLVIVQIFGLLVFVIPMIQLNKSVCIYNKLLTRIQLNSMWDRTNMIRRKMSLANFYEDTLCNYDGLRIWPLENVTQYSAYKFVSFYVSYLLFMVTLLKNEQSEQSINELQSHAIY